MARYRAADTSERRTASLSVHLTPSERAELDRRAERAGRALSDFARIVLLSDLKAPAPAERDPAAIAGLSFQLSKIGTNLNQLAKVANETRRFDFDAELRAVAAEIAGALSRVMEL